MQRCDRALNLMRLQGAGRPAECAPNAEHLAAPGGRKAGKLLAVLPAVAADHVARRHVCGRWAAKSSADRCGVASWAHATSPNESPGCATRMRASAIAA